MGWKDPRNSLTLPFWETLSSLRLRFLTGNRAQTQNRFVFAQPAGGGAIPREANLHAQLVGSRFVAGLQSECPQLSSS